MTPIGGWDKAADLLLSARRRARPLAALPAECRPATAAEGYLIQDAFVAQAGADRPGGAVAGFKIGATSPRAQAFLSCDGPFAGTVLARDLHDSPAQLPAGAFTFRLIEPEFAFRLGRDLPAQEEPYDEAAVAQAAASLHPAIEVVTSAFDQWQTQGVASLIADNGVNGALILGPACAEWREFDLPAHPVTLAVNGTPAGSGHGANALGGPLTALAWLANHRSGQGRGLKAGQVVTTGVVTEFVELQAGDHALADFGALGKVEVGFTG